MTISSLLYKYPLDLTGKNPTNLVSLEPHTVGTASQRAFVTNAGPFYTKDVVVREAISGRILIPYEQYLILQPYQEASVKTGLDVASIIYITDQTVDTEIVVDYQAVGGEFSWSVYALKAMLESLDLDNRPVYWGDLIGRPTEFRPSPHLHDLGDSYGWEYIAHQLEGIRNAILLGDAASHDELRQQLELSIEAIRDIANAVTNNLTLHLANLNNPHETTKVHVGLSNVENYGIASKVEAEEGISNTLYMTPKRTLEEFEFLYKTKFKPVPIVSNVVTTINTAYIFLGSHAATLPLKTGLVTGDSVSFGRIVSSAPTIITTDSTIFGINGTDTVVGYDIGTDIRFIWNATADRWEV